MSALEEYRKLADDRQWLIIDDIFDKADAAIAELEALVNANTDHMTEVGVEACRERDTRIAELEDELEHQTEARKHHAKLEREAVMAAGKAIKRAEQAEATLATRTANRDELVEMVRSLKAALAKWRWVATHEWVCPLGEMNPGEPGSYIVTKAVNPALLARAEEGSGT